MSASNTTCSFDSAISAASLNLDFVDGDYTVTADGTLNPGFDTGEGLVFAGDSDQAGMVYGSVDNNVGLIDMTTSVPGSGPVGQSFGSSSDHGFGVTSGLGYNGVHGGPDTYFDSQNALSIAGQGQIMQTPSDVVSSDLNALDLLQYQPSSMSMPECIDPMLTLEDSNKGVAFDNEDFERQLQAFVEKKLPENEVLDNQRAGQGVQLPDLYSATVTTLPFFQESHAQYPPTWSEEHTPVQEQEEPQLLELTHGPGQSVQEPAEHHQAASSEGLARLQDQVQPISAAPAHVQPTFTGMYINSPEDAEVLMGIAVDHGLTILSRRPTGRDMPYLVQSGHVIVYRKSIGFDRWTDRVAWSDERKTNGNQGLSVYRELRGRPGRKSKAKASNEDCNEDEVLTTSLTHGTFDFRPGGLLKRRWQSTAQVGTKCHGLILIAYYRLSDARSFATVNGIPPPSFSATKTTGKRDRGDEEPSEEEVFPDVSSIAGLKTTFAKLKAASTSTPANPKRAGMARGYKKASYKAPCMQNGCTKKLATRGALVCPDGHPQ